MQSSSSHLGRITSPRLHSHALRELNHPPTSKDHCFSPPQNAISMLLHEESPFRLDLSVRRLPCKTQFHPVYDILFAPGPFGIFFTLGMNTKHLKQNKLTQLSDFVI